LKREYRILLAAGVLLLIAAVRIAHLAGLELIDDEIWAIWRTMGPLEKVPAWVPYDWPPLYYIILWAWRSLTGINPLTVRFLSVLMALLGAAFIYRVLHKLFNERAAVFGMLVFGALSYSIFLSVYLRGYIFVVATLPLALWLTIRYFEKPVWKRGVLLGVLMAAMFYTYMTSAVAFGALGLFTLFVYPRQIWRWWLPAVVAFPLALPLVLDRAGVAVGRVEAIANRQLPSLLPALRDFYSHYGGDVALLWALIFTVASGFILYRARPWRARHIVLLVWMFGGPVLMYLLDNVLDFFSPRYSWWVMIGCVLWLGVALSYLPKIGQAIAGGAMIGMMLAAPVPFSFYALQPYRPFVRNFDWLAQRLQPGDAVILDTHCGGMAIPDLDAGGTALTLKRPFTCGTPEQWRYMLDVYFPDGGLYFVNYPTGQRRIWYVKQDGWHNYDLEAAIDRGRVAREFVGPWDFLVRLYEAPPDPEGVLFENGMRFHGFDFIDTDGRIWTGPMVTHDGEPIKMRLWWSVDRQIDRDYSVSLQLLRRGRDLLVASEGPQMTDNAPKETSRWQPGEIYIEERTIDIPWSRSPADYGVYLTVYYWEDGQRVAAPGVNADLLLPLQIVYVKSR
jgi:hypothetical protein